MAGFDAVQTNPLRTGLIWGVSFIPLFALVTRLTQDRWFTAAEWLGLVPAALIGGVVWAYIYRHILAGEARNAR